MPDYLKGITIEFAGETQELTNKMAPHHPRKDNKGALVWVIDGFRHKFNIFCTNHAQLGNIKHCLYLFFCKLHAFSPWDF